MKVTVIRVSMFEGKSHDAMKPLIFPILAELTPKKTDIEFIDDRIEVLPDRIDSDVIALSADTFSAKRAYIIAKRYKSKDNIIAIGGFHSTVLPDEAAKYSDVVLTGDAEHTWPKFIADAESKTVQERYSSTFDFSLGYVDCDHPVFKGKRYHNIGMVQFSRGCKYSCDFCSIKSMYPCAVRQKNIDTIVAELKNAREKLFFFIDHNLFLDEASAVLLFNAIKPLNKKWACQISLEIARNDRLLTLMKESGCILVLIGFESLNHQNLVQMNKSANLRMKDYERAIANIYRHKLMIYATFVLGYDYDTTETFEATLRFAIEHNFTVANFNPLIPMPGTPLYRRLKSESRLIYDRWWLNNNCHYGDTVYFPKEMSPEELRDMCKKTRYKFYNFKNIAKRLLSNPLHHGLYGMGVFLLANIISAREIRRKQGQLLGGILNETDSD